MRRLSVFAKKSPLERSSGSSDSTRSPTDLSHFLMLQKVNYLKAAEQGQARQWTVVMGNEAGDLDSMASSIAYAWYATKATRTLIIPLIHSHRDDLSLRAENLYALNQAGIDPSRDLLCLDDLPQFPTDKFALVDHNRLTPQFSSISEARVVAVIDHHEDEGLYKDTADPRIITVPTGSCSSLVTALFMKPTPDSSISIPPELATLLLSAVVIDTGGLKPGGKAEQQDRDAASFLYPHSQLSQQQSVQTPKTSSFPFPSSQKQQEQAVYEIPCIQELTKVLFEKKSSVAHLSTRDLLRRDYKEYNLKPSWIGSSSSSNSNGTSSPPPPPGSPTPPTSIHNRISTSSPIPSPPPQSQSPTTTIQIGLATVPRDLKDWIPSDPEFWTACDKYIDERNLSALGILTSFKGKSKKGKGKHKRQMLWIVREGGDVEAELRERLWRGLEESKELKVKVKELKKLGGAAAMEVGERMGDRVKCYKQGNAEATRKVTAPIVRNIVEGGASPNGKL